MEKLPISVIVITKNVEMIIDDCLDSVKKNNPAEIVIVDGNSSDIAEIMTPARPTSS